MVKSPLERAVKRVERHYEQMLRIPELADYVDEPLHYEGAVVNGKQVYILGEIHQSRAPFDYFRKNIQRQVIARPKDWLFFLEGGRRNQILGDANWWYLTQVATTFRIPVFQATDPTVLSTETRAHVTGRTGITEDQFYAIYLNFILTAAPDPTESLKNISTIARDLEVDVPTARRIVENGPLNLDFMQYIGQFWNELIPQRFRERLNSHPDRTKVLVNCGYMHNGCFKG